MVRFGHCHLYIWQLMLSTRTKQTKVKNIYPQIFDWISEMSGPLDFSLVMAAFIWVLTGCKAEQVCPIICLYWSWCWWCWTPPATRRRSRFQTKLCWISSCWSCSPASFGSSQDARLSRFLIILIVSRRLLPGCFYEIMMPCNAAQPSRSVLVPYSLECYNDVNPWTCPIHISIHPRSRLFVELLSPSSLADSTKWWYSATDIQSSV